MPLIDPDGQVCTVIVTVDAEADVLPELEAHAREGLTAASRAAAPGHTLFF